LTIEVKRPPELSTLTIKEGVEDEAGNSPHDRQAKRRERAEIRRIHARTIIKKLSTLVTWIILSDD
jgi:hypothetical protein